MVAARRTLSVAMPINWDDLDILGALDRLESAGRAYSMNGEDLVQAVADGRPVEDADRNTFARMLLMLRDETPQRLRFDQQQMTRDPAAATATARVPAIALALRADHERP